MSTRQSTRISKPSIKVVAAQAAKAEATKANRGTVKARGGAAGKRKTTAKRSGASVMKTRGRNNIINDSASEDDVEASPQDKEDVKTPEGSV